ncbi:MAG: FAD-binding protein [Candidatus Rokubacteria bacterium]|nr:FAD-binding protein [Candidatus Rokubacteria bacterium]
MNRLHVDRVVSLEVLVAGGGGAAARAAVAAAQHGARTGLAVKGAVGRCGSTAVAFGEITQYAAATEPNDSPEQHFQDTVRAGKGLCDERLARVLAEEAPLRLRDLVEWGVKFERLGDKIATTQGFAHRVYRGLALELGLERSLLVPILRQIRARDIPVFEHVMIARILVDGGRVVGALGIDTKAREVVLFSTPAVVLAVGGAHELYATSATSGEMTGDGYAMAEEVGGEFVNMEFVQMGPCAFRPPYTAMAKPLWSLEPRLTNARGEEFLDRYLPKDVSRHDFFQTVEFPFTVHTIGRFLAIATASEVLAGRGTKRGGVFCDLTHLGARTIQDRIPFTHRFYRSHGVDLAKHRVEYAIAAHCFHGGVRINERCETSVPGLYAAGETAGGLRGPQRPAGNSLAEGQVFGYRAGKFAAVHARDAGVPEGKRTAALGRQSPLWPYPAPRDGLAILSLKRKIQRLMSENAMVVKNAATLEVALSGLEQIEKEDLPRLPVTRESLARAVAVKNLVRVGRRIVEASIARKESLGGFYRDDYPVRDA